MPVREETVRSLLLEWGASNDRALAERLAQDFQYRSGFANYEREDFLAQIRLQVPWRELRVVAIIAGADKAALFFEGRDPTTDLSHRVAWLLEFRGELVLALTELTTIITLMSPGGRR